MEKESLDGHAIQASKNFRWNFSVLAMDGTLFFLGWAFWEPTTILPTLVNLLTGSTVLVGLITTIQSGGWFLPQLLTANYLEARERKKPFLIFSVLLGRIPIGVLALLMYLYGNNFALVLGMFFLAFVLFSVGEGLTGVPWTDIVSKAIYPRKRGYLFGSMQLLGGILAVGAGLGIKYILVNPDLAFPKNYSLLFFLAFAFFMISFLFLLLVKEPVYPVRVKRRRFREYVKRMPKLWGKNKPFKMMVLVRLLAGVGTIALPFYVIYAKEVLYLPDGIVGLFVSAQMGGKILASMLWGYLSDKKGNKIIIVLTNLLAFAAPLLVLAISLLLRGFLLGSPLINYLYLLLFAVIGAGMGGIWIGFTNYLLEMVTQEERLAYIALMNTLSTPLMVMPFIGGLIIKYSSYQVLFVIATFFCLTGLLLSTKLPEPRKDKALAREKGIGPARMA